MRLHSLSGIISFRDTFRTVGLRREIGILPRLLVLHPELSSRHRRSSLSDLIRSQKSLGIPVIAESRLIRFHNNFIADGKLIQRLNAFRILKGILFDREINLRGQIAGLIARS